MFILLVIITIHYFYYIFIMSLLKMTLNRNKKTSDAITGVLSFTHNGVEKKYNTLELLKEGNEEYYKSKTFRTCGTYNY